MSECLCMFQTINSQKGCQLRNVKSRFASQLATIFSKTYPFECFSISPKRQMMNQGLPSGNQTWLAEKSYIYLGKLQYFTILNLKAIWG